MIPRRLSPAPVWVQPPTRPRRHQMPQRGVSLFGAVLLVSGCGGDSGDSGEHAVQALASSTTASPAGTTQPASTELTITLANTEVPWHEEPPPLFDLVVADSDWGAGA